MNQEEAHDSKQQIANGQKQLNSIQYIKAMFQQFFRKILIFNKPANEDQTAEIFKLDVDCFDEIFDYLSFEDLISLSKTCKYLQQLTGDCFHKNYLGCSICSSEGIRSESSLKSLDIKHLVSFIRKIKTDSYGFRYVFNSRSKLQQIEHMEITNLVETNVNRLKEISMNELENLCISECNSITNFHGLIERCQKLKRLSVEHCSGEYNWLNQKYPTLEYLKFESDFSRSIPMFLKLNPNIRKFATNTALLWKNQHNMMAAEIKLDDLAVWMFELNGDKLKPMCDTLNKLHERGFYKKLQLYFFKVLNQNVLDQLINLNGLVKISIDWDKLIKFNVSALKSLEELHAYTSEKIGDLDILATDIIHLNRIHFVVANINDIIPFIRRSEKVQKIKVKLLRPGTHFDINTKIIDLLALNSERKQLPKAQKITLYVAEEIYLATKWALGKINFELIRLKRLESFNWNHDFDMYP